MYGTLPVYCTPRRVDFPDASDAELLWATTLAKLALITDVHVQTTELLTAHEPCLFGFAKVGELGCAVTPQLFEIVEAIAGELQEAE